MAEKSGGFVGGGGGETRVLSAVSQPGTRYSVVSGSCPTHVLEPRGREVDFRATATHSRLHEQSEVHARNCAKQNDGCVRGGGVPSGMKGHEMRKTPCANFAVSWFSLRHAGRFVKDALLVSCARWRGGRRRRSLVTPLWSLQLHLHYSHTFHHRTAFGHEPFFPLPGRARSGRRPVGTPHDGTLTQR